MWWWRWWCVMDEEMAVCSTKCVSKNMYQYINPDVTNELLIYHSVGFGFLIILTLSHQTHTSCVCVWFLCFVCNRLCVQWTALTCFRPQMPKPQPNRHESTRYMALCIGFRLWWRSNSVFGSRASSLPNLFSNGRRQRTHTLAILWFVTTKYLYRQNIHQLFCGRRPRDSCLASILSHIHQTANINVTSRSH